MPVDDDNVYSPLDPSKAQIRLVILQPGKSREIVRCDLLIFSLDDKPKYEALSYEWGDAKSSRTIVLNGKRKLVRENLYQALLHLRQQDSKRIIWIDALSINQSDIKERNHQVQEMRRIYSRASMVLSWLGLENDTTSAAFTLLQQAGAKNFRGTVLKTSNSTYAEYSETQWNALADLCDRPYWKRVWIVQEIGLATDLQVVCGILSAPWEYLSTICAMLEDPLIRDSLSPGQKRLLSSIPADFAKVRNVRRRGGGKESQLRDLCLTTHLAYCFDPRDKILGLLGLATDVRGSNLQADYAKTVFQVYEDVMLFECRKKGKHRLGALELLDFSVLLQNAFSWAITTNKSALPTNDLKKLLELPVLEGRPFLGIPMIVLGSITSLAKQDSDLSTGNVVYPIISTCSWAVRGFKNLKAFPKGGPISTTLSSMLVDFPPETQHPREILAFGFNSDSVGDGWVPMETKENDLVCELHKPYSLHVILRPADDRYLIVGRAIITNSIHSSSPILPSTKPWPDKLTLYMSSAVLQLLTCSASPKGDGP